MPSSVRRARRLRAAVVLLLVAGTVAGCEEVLTGQQVTQRDWTPRPALPEGHRPTAAEMRAGGDADAPAVPRPEAEVTP